VRNTAFVVVGLLFLIVQANVYRLIQVVAAIGDSVSGRLAAWGFESAVPVVKGMTWLISTPNLLLPLIVFTGVHEYSAARGALLALVLGYGLDVFASAPVGLFTFTSVAIFLLARSAGVRLAAQTMLTQVALAFVFALAQSVIVLVLLAIFSRTPSAARALLAVVPPNAFSTALAAPFVFRIAQRIHQSTVTVPRPGEGPPR
jgi:cell shape-determining protein MreD